MTPPNEMLISTTSTIEGFPIKQYLKPVTANLVAGTNLFSDIGAAFTDIFGGRSSNYQNQITQLYHNAIEELKMAASELGANCIVGLKVDMDEISGGGKSMFMLTAIGTAVIIEHDNATNGLNETSPSVASLRQIETLRKKKELIEKINKGILTLDKEIWQFITENQIEEALPFVLEKYKACYTSVGEYGNDLKFFLKLICTFLSRMPATKSRQLLYNRIIIEKDEWLSKQLIQIIRELRLFDFNEIRQMLTSKDFTSQKLGVALSLTDKRQYDNEDLEDLEKLKGIISNNFPERGKKIMKKTLLSSKEKEMWVCECGETNDINTLCGKCHQDIQGFRSNETKPAKAIQEIENKMRLIKEVLD